VGAVEPEFYAELVRTLGVADDPDFAVKRQYDRDAWPRLKRRLAGIFRTRTRDEWAALFEGTDACVAPVLAPEEAPDHPHHRARRTFLEVAGLPQPAPTPRFSRTPSGAPRPTEYGASAALGAWGVREEEIERLLAKGVVA